MVTINHVAIYVTDLERARTFYETYFDGTAGEKYHNPRTGLQTYFIHFVGGARLELMTRPDLHDHPKGTLVTGINHIAFSVGSRANVDTLTHRLVDNGYPLMNGPRTTGDGYYESVILDPEGNSLEITE